MSVFVDTSALYAVLDADDERHGAAKEEWSDLIGRRVPLHTTNYVLVETAALLQNRIGMDALRTLTMDVLPVITTLWVDEGIHRSAYHALLVSDRRQLSFVDCVSFEAMRRLGLADAFCFDPHFAAQGFTIIPTALP